MKKNDFLAELRQLSVLELKGKLREIAEELMKLRFRSATSQFDQTHQFKDLKKNIARVKSVLSEKIAQESDANETGAAA